MNQEFDQSTDASSPTAVAEMEPGSESDCQTEVSSEAAVSVSQEEAASDGMIDCPKCGIRSSWGEASWCPNCAYYPEIDEIVQSNPELQMREEEAAEEQQSAEERHGWILVTIGGVGAILLFSMAVRVFFYYNDGPRGQWCIVQTLVGLACFLVGQLLATKHAMGKSTGIKLEDAVIRPLTVWGSTIHELPRGKQRIYVAVWGMAISLFAMLCIGGVTSEMIFGNTVAPFRGKKINISKLSQSVPEPSGDEYLVDSLNDLQEQMEAPEELPLDLESPLSCQVYGFMRDGSETGVSRLLLCGMANGELRHVAIVGTGSLKASARQKLRDYLNNNTREQPLVDTKYRATWVNPVVGVVVEFDGWSAKNEMNSPKLSKIGRVGSTTKQPNQQADDTADSPENVGEEVDLKAVESALSE